MMGGSGRRGLVIQGRGCPINSKEKKTTTMCLLLNAANGYHRQINPAVPTPTYLPVHSVHYSSVDNACATCSSQMFLFVVPFKLCCIVSLMWSVPRQESDQ